MLDKTVQKAHPHVRASSRSLGVACCATFLLWVPLPIAGALGRGVDFETPPWLLLTTIAVLLPPVAVLAMLIIVRRLIQITDPTTELKNKIRMASFLTGPVGLLWAIWRLTEDM